MKIEVELKFAVADAVAVREKLNQLGAEFLAPVIQTDNYYAHPARDFAATDEALRIRRVGTASYLTYKGPKIDQMTKTREETEIPLAPVEVWIRIYEKYDRTKAELLAELL